MSFSKLISSVRLLRPLGRNSCIAIQRSYSSGKDSCHKDEEPKPKVENKVVKRSYSCVQDGCIQDGRVQDACVQDICVQDGCVQDGRVQDACVQDICVQDVCVQDGRVQDACVQDICVQDGCVQDSCVQDICVQESCVQDSCVQSSCVQDSCVQSSCVQGPTVSSGDGKIGVVLGVYLENNKCVLTPAAEEINQKSGGKIMQCLNELSCQFVLGKAFVITDIAEYSGVALACLGPRAPGYDELEALDVTKENIRWAVGAGVRALQRRCVRAVAVEACGHAAPAAEAATLAVWRYQEFKTVDVMPPCSVFELGSGSEEWRVGAVRGAAQNWARALSDTPANVMTPVDLAQAAIDVLCPLGVAVEAHGRDWIEAHNMQALLAVARGSCTEPMFIECTYKGAAGTQPPVLLAAKGVTFDSGGLCLKPCDSMVENRGSMAGAAVVLAAIKACAELKVPLNIHAVIPCCENMVSGQCMKVGDVVRALNGMSIMVEDTDLEGRLMLADALVYGQTTYKPELVIDVATLTHGVALATGGGAFGCFTSSELAWSAMRQAGAHSGDRPWRLPLWNYYTNQVTNDPSVDLRNKGSGKASPCLGAAFLKHFVCCDWMHVDITGVGKLAHGAPPYLRARRMTGRPARTLTMLLENIARDCNAQTN